METVLLAGRTTSRLGFGGSTLGSLSPSAARRLLAAAFDAGIRHFDVAPLYAFGRSEELLREALGSNLQSVTVTTKYGLSPPARSSWIGPAHRLARTALAALPTLRRRLRSSMTEAADPPLTAADAQRSIDESRRLLGLETIDLLLLHEATPERLLDPALLDTLERSKTAGRIREFGTGSRRERVRACLAQRSAFCNIVQFEWSAFLPSCDELDRCNCIVHGSLNGPREALQDWLRDDGERCDRWCEQTGIDLHTEGMVARLLLKASLIHHAGRIVLFSARSPRRIYDNVVTEENNSLLRPAIAFHRLIQQEFLESPPIHATAA